MWNTVEEVLNNTDKKRVVDLKPLDLREMTYRTGTVLWYTMYMIYTPLNGTVLVPDCIGYGYELLNPTGERIADNITWSQLTNKGK